uniref:Probable farnesyl diphosphate synthase n=2 Tax=Aureimonas frigidaquae TaxID=424757 RepID=A0A0P0Z1P0_9HYPH|nr:geranyltranstransferase [Aureimonas frigidaquae]
MTSTYSQAFTDRLGAAARGMEALLGEILARDAGVSGQVPERLAAAMRHGALGGGKRLRPFLVLESAALFGPPPAGAAEVAAGLECVHCYSLIHDDLPAMDDDDLRRGRPTVHKAFDEASAILAGDALLTLAFGLTAGATGLSDAARLALVSRLAQDAGAVGMVGGQALDLAAEAEDSLTEAQIARIQSMKTGALIAYACEAGAILMDAPAADRQRLRRYGEIIGLAFQLADDLLDETADAATLGKAAGKDRERGKKTLPALYGQDWTRQRLAALVQEAETVLAPYGEAGALLVETARYIAGRDR